MKKKNTAKGIIALLISQVFVKCFGLIYKLYLANKDGFGDLGNAIYNSGYQIYALLLTISTIGVPNVIAKLVAENIGNDKKINSIVKNALILFSIIGIFGSILLIYFSKLIANNILNIPEARWSLIALSPAIFNVCIISVLRGYNNGIENIEITAKSQTIEQILKTICTITLVEIGYIITAANTTKMAAIANFATTAATFGCLLYLCKGHKYKNAEDDISIRKMFEIVKLTIPISMSAILASLNRNIDSLTIVRYLKKFIGENLARKEYGILSGKIDVIASVPVSFVIAIATSIIPNIAKYNGKKEEIRILTCKYINLVGIIIIPCCIGMYFYSGEILKLLFGNENGKILLQINSVSLFFIAGEQIINAFLHGLGDTYVPAISLSIGVCLKAILNIFFLKMDPGRLWYGGIVGCSIATLTCHFVAFAIVFFRFSKKLKIKLKIFKFLLKPIIASCIMALNLRNIYFLFRGILIEKVAIILSGLIAIGIYAILIFLLNFVNKDKFICVKSKI